MHDHGRSIDVIYMPVLERSAGARPRLVRGLVFKTNGGFLTGVSAGSIPVRFRQVSSETSITYRHTRSAGAQMMPDAIFFIEPSPFFRVN